MVNQRQVHYSESSPAQLPLPRGCLQQQRRLEREPAHRSISRSPRRIIRPPGSWRRASPPFWHCSGGCTGTVCIRWRGNSTRVWKGAWTSALRVARDLHDTLLQSFHGLLPRFQAAVNLLPGRAADARQVLEAAVDDAAQAITEARDAVQDMRWSATTENDLAKAIEAWVRQLGAHQRDATGSATAFSVEVEGTAQNLHPILRDEIYRIAGEALRNAFHHARGAGNRSRNPVRCAAVSRPGAG